MFSNLLEVAGDKRLNKICLKSLKGYSTKTERKRRLSRMMRVDAQSVPDTDAQNVSDPKPGRGL